MIDRFSKIIIVAFYFRKILTINLHFKGVLSFCEYGKKYFFLILAEQVFVKHEGKTLVKWKKGACIQIFLHFIKIAVPFNT